MTRVVVSEKISTRATRPPELEAAVKLARQIRSSGVAVTLVVREHKGLGRGIELTMLAEELKASHIGLEFLTGELKGSHAPSGIVFTVLTAMSGTEREYIRDPTLEGDESARKRGKTIEDAGVTDEDMQSMALHLRDQEMSLRDIAKRLVLTTGTKKGQTPLTRHRHADAARTRRTGRHSSKPVPRAGLRLVSELGLQGRDRAPSHPRRPRTPRLRPLTNTAPNQQRQAAEQPRK
ncbi:recombinase family protein [Streptomyces oryzae]|uniref:recombinase family protein n=1 Tax=Streptomyces oryzae TaxID=1434886 RepID=UPI0027DE0FCD|nr:recombinase family protein [Streptomyces oryzae]